MKQQQQQQQQQQQNNNSRSKEFIPGATFPYSHGTILCCASLIMVSLMLFFMPGQGNAAEKQKIETNTQSFSVRLGATRVIYDPATSGETLSITNPQDYPILVQSQVLTEDMKAKAPFVVTPPLFRLDGQQQNRLSIVQTGGNFTEDRESLQWLCVKAIPPKADDEWAKDKNGKSAVERNVVSLNIKVSMNSCIKLFVRPANINGHPDDVAASLAWYRQGNQLKAVNDTPFYMNLSSLTVGGKNIPDMHYVPPFSSYIFPLPKGTSGVGKVAWTIVNDYGGNSQMYLAEIK